MGPEMRDEVVGRLKQGVIDYDEDAVETAAREAVAEGVDARDAMMNGLAAGIAVVGDLMAAGEYFASEVMMSVEAVRAGMDVLAPDDQVAPETGRMVATETADGGRLGPALEALRWAGARGETDEGTLAAAIESVSDALSEEAGDGSVAGEDKT
jgi:hypothetical protein